MGDEGQLTLAVEVVMLYTTIPIIPVCVVKVSVCFQIPVRCFFSVLFELNLKKETT